MKNSHEMLSSIHLNFADANKSPEYLVRYIWLTTGKQTHFLSKPFHSNMAMVFPQVIATFLALFEVIGLPGDFLVIATIVLERRFHVMRYILLASLAVSDFLFLILVNSFRIASIAHERWLYGETMCHLNPFFSKYFYLNTVLHLVVVSYERYSAIVKSPLTYDGTISKSRMLLIGIIWVVPIPLSVTPFHVTGWGKYVYNPEVFFREYGWAVRSDFAEWWITFFLITTFVAPFLVIILFNWSVYKAAKVQINAINVQVGSTAGSENHLREMSRRINERKAAVDISIIIAAFVLSFLPGWIVGICRQFMRRTEVQAEVLLVTSSIFIVSSLCNPIIYSIRKRDFRTAVINVFRRIRVCRCSSHGDDNTIDMRQTNSSRFHSGTKTNTSTHALPLAHKCQET